MTSTKDSTSAVSKEKTPSDVPVPSSSPTEFPTPAEARAMLAKEMNHLSVEEREKVLEDIHGIARVMDEPQEFVEASFALLEKELDNIPSKAAYNLASSMSKDYTSSRKIRLMFLRAESFDPSNAASRIVRFFEEKCALFGAHKLTKDITLDDLDPDDIAALERGFYQVLPGRDCAGRKVFCFFPKLRVIRTHQNLLRASYYTLMRSVEDDGDVQKRGVVACAYSVGGGLNFDLSLLRKTSKLRNSLPARFNSVHVCYNDPLMAPVFSLAMFIMRTHTRMRFRAHYGSDEECQSQLRSFGFPISALPVSSQGEFNLENHRNFLAMQQAIEATNKSKGGKGQLRVAQKGKEKPQKIIEDIFMAQENMEDVFLAQENMEDVFLEAPQQPNLDASSAGHGAFTSLRNFLPNPSFAIPWWNVPGVPNFLPLEPPQSKLPFPPQSHILGPTSICRPPEKLGKSPGKPYVICNPLPNDVLFGRGRPIQERPGNVRFREMLERHIDCYDKGEKGAKATVSAFIVYLVKEDGGRFLKGLDDGGWVEVDEAAARAKVTNAFRTRRQSFQANLKKDKGTA